MKTKIFVAAVLVFVPVAMLAACSGTILLILTGDVSAKDNGIPVDLSKYANRQVLPDFTSAPCQDNPRGLTQIKGNLYRYTTGPGLAVHSGLALITTEGAVVIDPAMTCTSTWLRDEIKSRFHVPVKCLIYTHAHAAHISGSQIFKEDILTKMANCITINRNAILFLSPSKGPIIMNQDQKEKAGSETLLAAWMKATVEFWGAMAKMRPDALEMATPSEEAVKSRAEELWQSTLKMWQSMFSTLNQPEAVDALSKGVNALPEIILKMAKTGWDGYFHLQQQWMERVGRIGQRTEAYKFEGIDQDIFKVWAEIYEKEFRQFLAIPQLGLTRFYQERMTQTVDKFNLFLATMAEFFHLLYLPMEKSFRVVQEKVEELTREGKLPENIKEYYLMWLKILEGHYMTLFKSPEYTQVLSNTLNATEEFMVARQEMIQDMLQTLPVPTNREMNELYKELYLLKKKVKELTKKVDQR